MEKNSELIIEVADEYESLKSFESGNAQMDDFDDMRIGAAGTELPMIEADFRERFEQKCTYPSLEITYLAVSRKYQNMKIGSTLIDFVANIARNQKVSGCVFLTVNALHTANYSAVSFYEKNHFAKLTPVPQLDVWPMYKTLWY